MTEMTLYVFFSFSSLFNENPSFLRIPFVYLFSFFLYRLLTGHVYQRTRNAQTTTEIYTRP
jgi:hypothetical protein